MTSDRLGQAENDHRSSRLGGRDRAPTVCLATSPGGHIAELLAIRGAFSAYRRVWVTGRSRQADELRGEGEEVCLLPSWGRDTRGLEGFVPNLRAARRIVARHRPAAVVTNGAGLVVPLAMMARAAGGRLVVIETMARVTEWSLTGRILAPIAHSLLVQWPEMRAGHPRAIVCRPALLESVPAPGTPQGEGTFVSVGTRPEPFDRLLAAADRAVAGGILPRPVIAQSGVSSYEPATFSTTPWQTQAAVEAAIRAARYVVCHGGSGLIAAAIAAGRRPLVMPRRKSAGEHRTEHQQQIVDKLAAEGYVVAVDGEIGRRELALADEPPVSGRGHDQGRSLEAVVAEELSSLLG